jgi:N-acetylglucosamine-6-sulfatase
MSSPRRRSRWTLAAVAVLLACAATVGALSARDARGASGYNVVFFLTDDQTLQEMAALPSTTGILAGGGVQFTRAYVTYPLCCPSRATLFSGQYMHNHGVRGNQGEFGGWPRFFPRESDSLGTWLQDEGVYTVHIGKYMNAYVTSFLHVPPGWDEWYGKGSPSENNYLNYSMTEQGPVGPVVEEFYGSTDNGEEDSDYSTDVYKHKALDALDRVGDAGPEGIPEPFFLNVAFGAPHGPYQPAARHLYSYSSSAVPQLPKVVGFNEKNMDDKPAWLRQQAKKIPAAVANRIEQERRRRLEQLRAVDEAVAEVYDKLIEEDLLDRTYMIFTSDNGFFRGEHRIVNGKYLPYESSSRVPLLIRGPGVPEGEQSSELVSTLDIPSTILDIVQAPGPIQSSRDGRSLLPYAADTSLRTNRPLIFEGDTGPGRGAGGFTTSSARAGIANKRGVKNLEQEPIAASSFARGTSAPAYRGLRTDRYALHLYSDGSVELYDMLTDPAQLKSLQDNRRYKKVKRWLLGRLWENFTCAGAACRIQLGDPPKPAKKRVVCKTVKRKLRQPRRVCRKEA